MPRTMITSCYDLALLNLLQGSKTIAFSKILHRRSYHVFPIITQVITWKHKEASKLHIFYLEAQVIYNNRIIQICR